MVRVLGSFVPAALLLMVAACSSAARAAPAAHRPAAPPESASAGSDARRDGSSPDRAVVVPRDNERDGVAWEYAWIREHYGESRRKEQGLAVDKAGRTLDRITVELSDGTERTFYFDITRYFGRF